LLCWSGAEATEASADCPRICGFVNAFVLVRLRSAVFVGLMAGIDPKELGRLVKQARESARLTQAQLAELTGVSDETIRRIELGKYEPSLSTFVAIADALTLPLAGLMGRSMEPGSPSILPPLVHRLAVRACLLATEAQKALLLVAEAMPERADAKPGSPRQPEPPRPDPVLLASGIKRKRPAPG
jgi:putative transcriptional regulator